MKKDIEKALENLMGAEKKKPSEVKVKIGKEDLIPISVRIEKKDKERLKEIFRREGIVSLSAAVRKIIYSFLEKNS